jgi:hypothetical protein
MCFMGLILKYRVALWIIALLSRDEIGSVIMWVIFTAVWLSPSLTDMFKNKGCKIVTVAIYEEK